MKRRTVLATVGATAAAPLLAGCSDPGATIGLEPGTVEVAGTAGAEDGAATGEDDELLETADGAAAAEDEKSRSPPTTGRGTSPTNSRTNWRGSTSRTDSTGWRRV